MKTLLIITPFWFATIAIACSQDTASQDSLLEKIALDDAYHAFQTAFLEQAYHIGIGTYDLALIGEVLKKLEKRGEDLCSMKENPLTDIRGGNTYKENTCALLAASEVLAEKYPGIWEMSDEQQEIIRNKYYEDPEHYQHQQDIYYHIKDVRNED